MHYPSEFSRLLGQRPGLSGAATLLLLGAMLAGCARDEPRVITNRGPVLLTDASTGDVDPGDLLAPYDPTPVSPDDFTAQDPVEQFVLEYAVNFCNKIFACEHPRVSEYAYDNGLSSPQACMYFYQLRYAPQRLSKGVDEGRLAFDRSATDACLTRIEQMSCSDFGARVSLLAGDFIECRDVLSGQVTDGECFAGPECPDGQVCRAAAGGAACEGDCKPIARPCGDTTCDPFAEYCDREDNSCKPRPAAGDSCTRLGQCQAGSTCFTWEDPAVCRSSSGGLEADAQCNPEAEFCPSGTTCYPYPDSQTPVCRRLGDAQAPCSISCLATAYCPPSDSGEGTSCVERLRAGQACEDDRECRSGRCSRGSCVDPATPCMTR